MIKCSQVFSFTLNAAFKLAPERGKEWDGVIVLVEPKKKTEHPQVQCKFCDHTWWGGATKHRQHWIRPAVGSEVSGCEPESEEKQKARDDFVKSLSEWLAKKEEERAASAKRSGTQPAAKRPRQGSSSDTPSSSRGARQSTLIEANNAIAKEAANAAVSRFFAACGVPYNVAESSFFKDMIKVVSVVGGSYVVPHRNTLRTTLLAKEKTSVEASLEPIRETIKALGCTLTSDGWSDRRSRPLLNFLAVCPEGEMFIEAVDTSNETKSAEYMAEQVNAVIKRHNIDVKDIVHVVTDSAAACRLSGELLEEEHGHLVWTPCTTHQLDLLLESLGKLHWMSETIKDGRSIVTFITGRHKSLALYRTKSLRGEIDASKKELLKPGETRFASAFIMLQRLLEVKDALRQTVVDDEWPKWLTGKPYEEEGERVADLILSSQFWKKVEDVVKVSEPIVQFLRLTDGRAPIVGKIYYRWFKLIEKLLDMDCMTGNQKECVVAAARARWDKGHTIIHSVGYCLDPEYRSHDQYSNPEVKKNFKMYLKRCFPDTKELAEAEAEYRRYKSTTGEWTSSNAMLNAQAMAGHLWWQEYCADLPLIRKVAMRVLAQCSSSSSCERVWSTFDFIHSKKRNRLSSQRLNDLVFVHYNLRLLQRRGATSTKDAFVPWEEEDSDPEEE